MKAVDHLESLHGSEISGGSVVFNRMLRSLASTIELEDYRGVAEGSSGWPDDHVGRDEGPSEDTGGEDVHAEVISGTVKD